MSYTFFDQKVKDAFSLVLKVPNSPQLQSLGGVIEFQFPPKISTDSKRGNWKDTGVPGGAEPIAIFMTAGPRDISMHFSYIVTHGSNSDDINFRQTNQIGGGATVDNRWTAEKIHRQLRKLRGYFVLMRDKAIGGDGGFAKLIVKMKLAGMGGFSIMTGRIIDVNVKYSDTLVASNSGLEDRTVSNGNFTNNNGNEYLDISTTTYANAFPLRTDVTLNLRLWTQLGEVEEPESDPVVPLPGLLDTIPVDWY
jgi:hypothetical protein